MKKNVFMMDVLVSCNGKLTQVDDMHGNVFWFSYRTLIAFEPYDKPLVIRENVWSRTTGRHLNDIDNDHSKRISAKDFEIAYYKTFGGLQ